MTYRITAHITRYVFFWERDQKSATPKHNKLYALSLIQVSGIRYIVWRIRQPPQFRGSGGGSHESTPPLFAFRTFGGNQIIIKKYSKEGEKKMHGWRRCLHPCWASSALPQPNGTGYPNPPKSYADEFHPLSSLYFFQKLSGDFGSGGTEIWAFNGMKWNWRPKGPADIEFIHTALEHGYPLPQKAT